MDFDHVALSTCHTLWSTLWDQWDPAGKFSANFQQAEGYLQELVNTDDPSKELTDANLRLLKAFLKHATGRTFFFTNECHVGLAPKAAQPNDIVVLILGCQSPMVLRPRHNKQLMVVGECYVHGIMVGEPLLGPLPVGWQRIYRRDEQIKSCQMASSITEKLMADRRPH